LKKVLITGAAGYIGSVLTRVLLDEGYSVRGLDSLSFGGYSLFEPYFNPNFEFIRGDIRNSYDVEKAINGVDAVVHLAAVVGDPACAKEPELASEINWEASKKLFDSCGKVENIKNFVFASTCSNYGRMENDGYVNEESPLRPVSIYATLKVKFEDYLMNSNIRDDLATTSLRFSTVYGLSPRLRFDLTVNEFIRTASFSEELVIYGEQFWRPYCHVSDLARSCELVLRSDPKLVKSNVFGVGDTSENYQKKMLVEEIQKIIPNAKVKYVEKNEDPRNYRVDFTKIKKELGFEITKTVPDGLREINSFLKSEILSDPYSPQYSNIGVAK